MRSAGQYRIESSAATSAPYTGADGPPPPAGQYVSVSGSFPPVQVADHRRQRARRVNRRAMPDALPHHPPVGRARVDHRRGDGCDALIADDRVVLHPNSSTGIFRFLGSCGADPLGQFEASDKV